MARKEKYICSHEGCSAKFSRRYRFDIHVRTHTGERPYVCTYGDCMKSYARSSHLNRHEATHEQKSIRCSYDGCTAVLKGPATLRKHVAHKHINKKTKTYKCSHCDQEFNRHSWVKVHEYKHTGIKPYLCPKAGCEKRFLVPSKLRRHLKVHDGYKCFRGNCNVTCLTWSLYLKHMKVVHPPDLKCDVCSKSFSTMWNLDMHRKTHIDPSERALYFCPVPNCLRSYTEERNVKYHVKKYHEQRPFHCTFEGCALSFKNEDQLTRHQRAHDPNIPLPKKRRKKLKQRKKEKLSFAALLSGYRNEPIEDTTNLQNSIITSPLDSNRDTSSLSNANGITHEITENLGNELVLIPCTSGSKTSSAIDEASKTSINCKIVPLSNDESGKQVTSLTENGNNFLVECEAK